MVVFPNCKINVGLHVTGKRTDGFHNIETVFLPVNLNDALEIIPSAGTAIEYTSSGLTIEGSTQNNLCIKAFQLLKKDFPSLPAVKLHLHKNIPMGAGLGGGSADGAFTLQLLNEKFKLGISTAQLLAYAVQLGSDCPFFIINKPCYAMGRGEILEEIKFDLSSYKLVLINPGIHVDTGWAFSQLTPALPGRSIKEILHQPISTWKEELKNDFEMPVFEKYAEIKNIKEELYKQGAVYASMTGSGSSVFGVFEKQISLDSFAGKNYFNRLITC